ncbi:MAG TPA: MBL fold metallo-hydrolase [Clostridia bacterium]|nr:MBL fold metallo-hydrolase [Clostridia bacterium]
MALRITALIEDSPGEDTSLEYEHGLSFFIEYDGHTLLFDTGQTGAFVRNAEVLGVNLMTLEKVVLSHGHYDHTGGLLILADTARSFELYLKECIFQKKYAHKEGRYEFKGNAFNEADLRNLGIRYRFVQEDCTELLPGVWLITNFPRVYADEAANPRFVLEEAGVYRQDRFDDEVVLALESPRGLVVLLGCSHPGVRNMLDHVKAQLKQPIYAVLGGTHLVEADEKRTMDAVEYLLREVSGPIGISHCSGKAAMAQLKAATPRYFHNKTGSVLEV